MKKEFIADVENYKFKFGIFKTRCYKLYVNYKIDVYKFKI